MHHRTPAPTPGRRTEDLRGVLGSVVAGLSGYAAERRVQVNVRLPAPLAVRDIDDEAVTRLRQAWRHLLAHAIRRSPEGATVLLDAGRDESEAVEIVLRDAGPTLSAAELASSSGAAEDGRPDAGLDLSGCRHVAQALGGQLDVHDRPVGGLCIVMRLGSKDPAPEEGD